jgi:hypothetical protein
MPTPESQKLACGSCGHENEVERVYCHNCGEKLDRSVLPVVETVVEQAVLTEETKRVKKMMNPSRGSSLRHVRTFCLIVVFAAVVAAVFLICQAPDNVPLEKTERMPENDAAEVWSQLMASPQASSATLKEFDVNYYLKRAIKSTAGPVGTKFKRAFVSFTPGSITISTHRDIWGQPFFTSATYKPVMTNGKWSAQLTGINIGRLGIHPSAAMFATVTTGGLSKVFEKELKQVDRLASIEPGKATIRFVTKPAQ